jgi:CheY-like chemotaxis protein
MKRVLYVEDDPINAFVIQKLLKSDFEILHVIDGESCLALMQRETVDLILMDIDLGKGKMDGSETMKHIRAQIIFKHIPIFALTSHAMPEDEDRFMKQGFDFYLAKPIEQKVLIGHINRFLI